MVSALQDRQRQASRLIAGSPQPALHLHSDTTEQRDETEREGLITRGLRGLFSYLTSSRILYVHPSLEHRIKVLREGGLP